jgi:GTPase
VSDRRSMHVNRVAVKTALAGQCVTFALHMPSAAGLRKHFKGTVLLAPSSRPSAAFEFEAEVRRRIIYPDGYMQ